MFLFPGAAPVVRCTGGGFSPGWEGEGCGLPAPAAACLAADTAIPKEKLRLRAPGSPDAVPAAAEVNPARTLTVSPSTNGRPGTNATPPPSGKDTKRPPCAPLLDPDTTGTPAKSERRKAEKITSDPGEASGVPGNGTTRKPGRATAMGVNPVSSTAATASGPVIRSALTIGPSPGASGRGSHRRHPVPAPRGSAARWVG